MTARPRSSQISLRVRPKAVVVLGEVAEERRYAAMRWLAERAWTIEDVE